MLIESRLKEMQPTEVIIALCIRWKKPVKSAITLDSEDVESAKDLESTGDIYAKLERLFNSLMTEFFKSSNIKELMQRMFAHIMMQMENSCIPESDFMLDQIMHLHINFHNLALTHGSIYIELPE